MFRLTGYVFIIIIVVGLKLNLAVFPPLKMALIASKFHNPSQIIILYGVSISTGTTVDS